MRSGSKNAVVTIFRNTETGRDPDSNNPIYGPVAWKTDLFCNMTPRRGREIVIDGKVGAETYMKFDFEYYDVEGIDETMFIVHEGVTYDIKAILRDAALKDYTAVDTISRPS